MKVTVCELSDDQALLASEWLGLVSHVRMAGSQLVLLPELPFYPWWMSRPAVEPSIWGAAEAAHRTWEGRLGELLPAKVLATSPKTVRGERLNEGFVWEKEHYSCAHHKHYLPNEAGFWEATWCSRGDGSFAAATCGSAKVGFLICTELWAFEAAREYGKAGAHVIASPRASVLETRDRWLVAGRAAAIVAGAFVLSSNRRGRGQQGIDFGGAGWVIDPDGTVLGVTAPESPFLTVDIDLEQAVRAKVTYPRCAFM